MNNAVPTGNVKLLGWRRRQRLLTAILMLLSVTSDATGLYCSIGTHHHHHRQQQRYGSRWKQFCPISIATRQVRGGAIVDNTTRRAGVRLKSSNNDNAIVSRTATNDAGESEDKEQTNVINRRGIAFSLAMTYFTVMGAKCALPVVLPMLISPETGLTFPKTTTSQSPQQLLATLLMLSTLAVALGKLLLGPVIDRLGGILSLRVALSALAALLLVITTFGQSFATFAVSWIFVDFIFSSAWAACINAIHQCFAAQEWPRQIGNLAAAARTGNAAAFFLFAFLLRYFEPRIKQSWRVVFAMSAILQLIPLCMLSYFGKAVKLENEQVDSVFNNSTTTATTLQVEQSSSKSSPSILSPPSRKPSFKRSLIVLKKQAATMEFWLHLSSRSVLMVFASFLLFVPTYMTKVHSVSSSSGAQVGSLYAAGCLLAVTAGARAFAKLSTGRKRSKLLTLTALLGGATVSSAAQLGHVMGMWHLSAGASAALFFFWGLSFSIPFYIPPSLYALRKGGRESSATIADIFDVGGFTLLALFNGYVASIAHAKPAAWIPTFALTTFCAVISYLSLSLATLLEDSKSSSC